MKKALVVKTTNPPVIELDGQAHAAYVKFSDERGVETKVVAADDCVITMDLNEAGEVIGVELLGVKEFSLEAIADKMPIRVGRERMRAARLVPVGV